MPVELTPAPMAQAYLPASYLAPSHMPRSGPARIIDCLPAPALAPGSIKPNGLRNPWAVYSQGASWGNQAHAHQQPLVANHQSHIYPWPAPSVIYPHAHPLGAASVHSSATLADGWDGAAGRQHHGYSPDMTATPGSLPRLGGGWRQAPSSPANHARMMPTSEFAQSIGGIRQELLPPIGTSSSYRPRRSSIRAVQIVEPGCADCDGHRTTRPHGGGGSLNSRSVDLERGQSHYRKLAPASLGPPIHARSANDQLKRKVSTGKSHRSHRSRSSSVYCAECAM